MDSLTIINAIASTTTITAAILVASNYSPKAMLLGFVTYTIASLAWIASGVVDAKMSLVIQNGVLLFVSLFGIWRWLPKTIE